VLRLLEAADRWWYVDQGQRLALWWSSRLERAALLCEDAGRTTRLALATFLLGDSGWLCVCVAGISH
jgi:hypothetical protein